MSLQGLIDIMPEFIQRLPSYMDFEGQRRAERIFQVIIVIFSVVGFVWGYICQQFSQTMYILIAGFALSCVLTLPPWPMYRKNPLQWQKPQIQNGEQSPKDKPAQSNKGKKKK